MVRGMDPDELQRAFFDAIYTYRIVVGLAGGVFAVGARRWSHGGSAGSGRLADIPYGRGSSWPSAWRSPCRSATTSRRRSGSGPSSSSPTPSRSSIRPRRRSRRPLEPTSRRRPSRRRAPRPDVSASATPSRAHRSSRAVSPAAPSTAPTISTSAGGPRRSSRRRPAPTRSASRRSRCETGRTSTSTCRPSANDYVKGAVEVGTSQGDRWRLRVRAAGGHGSGRFRQRDHLVQAVLAPVRGGSAGGRLTLQKYAKVRYWQRFLKRVPSRP